MKVKNSKWDVDSVESMRELDSLTSYDYSGDLEDADYLLSGESYSSRKIAKSYEDFDDN